MRKSVITERILGLSNPKSERTSCSNALSEKSLNAATSPSTAIGFQEEGTSKSHTKYKLCFMQLPSDLAVMNARQPVEVAFAANAASTPASSAPSFRTFSSSVSPCVVQSNGLHGATGQASASTETDKHATSMPLAYYHSWH